MGVADRVAEELQAEQRQAEQRQAREQRQAPEHPRGPELIYKTKEQAIAPLPPVALVVGKTITTDLGALLEGIGEALGTKARELRDDFEREINFVKRDLEQAQTKMNAQAELEGEREALRTKAAEADRAELVTLRHELGTKCAEARADLNRELDLVKRELNTRVELERHAKQLRDEITVAREAQAQAGEELLRREVAALRDQIGLQKELESLRKRVADAQAQIPEVPAIIARLQTDAENTRADITGRIVALDKELHAAKDKILKLRVQNSETQHGLKRLERQAHATTAKAEIEIETSTSIFSMRGLDPETAKTLRAFAEQVIDAKDHAPLWLGPPAGSA
jgi:chromosome segregation ATPase